jgi:hypothetical protein
LLVGIRRTGATLSGEWVLDENRSNPLTFYLKVWLSKLIPDAKGFENRSRFSKKKCFVTEGDTTLYS